MAPLSKKDAGDALKNAAIEYANTLGHSRYAWRKGARLSDLKRAAHMYVKACAAERAAQPKLGHAGVRHG